VAVTVSIVIASAGVASAHAVVASSQPGDKEQLTTAPSYASVTFNESVSPDLGGLTVLDSQGNRVDDGTTTQPEGETLRTNVKSDAPNGTYVMNYRVISADGHPVSGAIVYSIGTQVDEGSVANVQVKSNPVAEVAGAIGRFIAYAGGLLAAGLVFFVWFVHDGGPDGPGLEKIVRRAAVVAVVGQLVVIAAQSVLASGEGISSAFNPAVVSKVLAGELGWASLVLFLGLAGVVAAGFQRNELAGQCLAFYGFVTVAVSYALWGHDTESDPRWLAISADVLHLATAALWFGGLVGLAVVLRGRSRAARQGGPSAPEPSPAPRGGSVAVLDRTEPGGVATDVATDVATGLEVEDDEDELVDTVGIVIRFSTLATVSILLLGLAGVTLAWIQLGSVGALFSTTYGRTLLVKLVLVGAVGVAGAYNHFRLLPVVLEEPADTTTEGVDAIEPDLTTSPWTRLFKLVGLEAIGIVAVLAVTGVLVNLTPGATASSDNFGPYNATLPVPNTQGQVNMEISPAQAGANAIHITFLSADNRAAELATKVTVQMTLPDKGIGPINREATKSGVGHFIVLSTPDMSIAGTWTVTLVARTSEFQESQIPFQVPIAS
jgi:copper transport protein